jgi:carbon-monoxide dehydrogenase medium subunit
MKPAPFEYHAPATLQEALELINTLDNYKILAGGQSLMPMMNFRFVMPDHVIDINHIAELSRIEQRGEKLFIGAMTRQHDIHMSELVRSMAPIIAQAYEFVSHRQIRNRGTYGGSLCHLDPSSEQPCFTAALDGVIHVANAQGTRQVPMSEWTSMYMTPALNPNELMLGVELTPWKGRHGYAFEEYSRRHGDYAVVAVAALLAVNAQGSIDRVRLVLSGTSAAPCVLTQLQDAIIGQTRDAALALVAQHIDQLPDVMEDAHYTSQYRRHLAKTLCQRALVRAFETAH